jgi:hypothetical protein
MALATAPAGIEREIVWRLVTGPPGASLRDAAVTFSGSPSSPRSVLSS